MVLEQLIDEVEKLFENNDEKKKSIDVSQGKKFLELQKKRQEGFVEGMTANEKTNDDIKELDMLENELQRAVSNYAISNKALASNTLNYLESEKSTDNLRETNVAVVKRTPYPNANLLS